jgi:hypothetical protein
MLSDEQHAVDRKRASTERQRFRDRRVQLHRREFLQPRLAHIVVANLIDVDRDQIHCRVMVRSVPAIAFEEAVDNVLGVGVLEVRRADCRDLGPAPGRLESPRRTLRAQDGGSGCNAREQCAPGDFHAASTLNSHSVRCHGLRLIHEDHEGTKFTKKDDEQ